MRIQLNHSKFNRPLVVLLLLLLLVGLTIACGSSDTLTPALVTDKASETIQDTESGLAKVAADIVDGDLGEVSLVGDSVSDKQVIIFEERHDSRSGQIEIAVMLVRLYDDYGMRYIALEGALEKDDPLDAAWYQQLSDKDTLTDIAVQTLREGEISSAEFIAMALPDVTVQGIEIAEEYDVKLDESAGSAPTLYLYYIASLSLTDDEIAKFNELYEADKVLEAVEFVISTDEWTQSRYENLTDSDSIVSIEDLIKVMEEIEAKADEVDAPVDADTKAGLQNYKHFFEAASQRSDTMVDNTLALLDEHPTAPIAMIIGAAHTARISDLFDGQGISHIVIRPKALAIEEPGELGNDAYDRKLQALSVDEEGWLGALLDGRKKPPPVLQQLWFQAKAEVKVVTTRLARAVGSGAKPPFDEPPYDLQNEFASYPHVSVNWDSIVIEEPDPREVVFSLDVIIDEAGNTKTIWVRAVRTTETIASPTDVNLEKLLLEALDDVRNETSLEAEEQPSRDNENPAVVQISHDTLIKASDTPRGVSKRIIEI